MLVLNTKLMHSLIGGVIKVAQVGQSLTDGMRLLNILKGYDVALRTVHTSQIPDCLASARWFPRPSGNPFDITAIQILWPNMDGHFPWDDGFASKFEGVQLLLFEGKFDA